MEEKTHQVTFIEQNRKLILITISLLVGLAILAVVIWQYQKNKSSSNNTVENLNASDIQNIFSPPPINSLGQTPNPTPQISPKPIVSTPNPNSVNPRSGSNPGINSPTIQPTPMPAFQTYINSALGFKINLLGTWQESVASDGSIVLLNSESDIINIQTFKAPNENLEIVKQQLLNSPSVSNLQEITFENYPALSFTTNSNTRAIAIVYKSSLYYIFGINFIGNNNFEFIN